MSKICVQSKWSELQTDLLELILKKLPFDDVVRVCAVCHSWNTVVRSSPLPGILWLMLPEGNKDHGSNTLGFFNLKEKRFYYKVSKNLFCGVNEYSACRMDSTQGWIMIFDKGTPKIYNPFSGDQIQLPPPNIYPSNSLSFSLILSSDPCRNKDYTVIAMHYNNTKHLTTLMFYKPARDDNEWTTATTVGLYRDIICHNDKLYGLTSNERLDVWDFSRVPKNAPVLIKVDVTISQKYRIEKNMLSLRSTYLYLVESLGEILIVLRTVAAECFSAFKLTMEFTVSKLHYSEKKWIPIQDLPPGRTILLIKGGSTCVSIQDFPEFEENSIYYLDYHCLGVYNLKKKTFCRHEFENSDTEPRPPVLVIRNT